ncbi:sodium:solute symporter [Lignipirellula cremea]|uniref:Sodium/glucose cotransporter n=1 Tax=Lignipirellula cremea TaxID=2528010 RepID=A0A518E1M7_9BACT|nr:sodium:solute symporter [Lignipirellula cremea]QDU97971.1 Sodium/glucose cotransporter [Lignipirellula cremea]
MHNEIEVRLLDLLVVGCYLAAIASMGFYFSRRNQSTEEYFLGGRSFPGWAIGLSMLGTSISSVTFLAFPAAAFVLDWRQLVSNLTLPLVAVLAILVFIPFFRRGQLTSAFEYLEDRFGPAARMYGSLSFLLLQLLRLAKVLFLVSIPVSLLTGVEMHLVIIGVGVFIAFYTVIGGFDAVIWTDVIQSLVLWFGGLVCFVYIAWNLPGGIQQIFEVASEHDKFHLGAMEFSLSERTFWTVALLGIFSWLAMYSSDQNFVQRYVAAKSLREARRATVLYSLVAVPTWAFFFLIGTCVFVWYQVYPSELVPWHLDLRNDPPTLLPGQLRADQIFPYFLLTQIPAGLAGLIIAGVLAAAMSSLDSSINAIATVMTVDLVKPYLAKKQSDRTYLFLAKGIAAITAMLMIGGAIGFHRAPKESTNDLSWIIASVFGGCMVGMFMVGFFTRRVDHFSVLAALLVSTLVNVYLGLCVAGWLPKSLTLEIHSYWVGILVNLLFVVVAYGVSLFRRQTKDLRGLTVWTMEGK